jgi:hypothetical protein
VIPTGKKLAFQSRFGNGYYTSDGVYCIQDDEFSLMDITDLNFSNWKRIQVATGCIYLIAVDVCVCIVERLLLIQSLKNQMVNNGLVLRLDYPQ